MGDLAKFRASRWSAGPFLAFVLYGGAARADADKDKVVEGSPFQLYEAGKRAYDEGDFDKAGNLLARADELAPNASVLDLAMAAARKSDDPVLGMELVGRAEHRGLDIAAHDGRLIFGSRVGLLSVVCPGSARCEARVDGAAFEARRPRWLLVGEHSVTIESDGTTEHFSISVEANKTMVVRPSRVVEVPAKTPPTPGPLFTVRESGPPSPPPTISARWFWGGVIATGMFGAATIASGLDTLATRSSFRADPSNEELAASGRSAETRTNILLVSTLVLATATTAAGYLIFTHSDRHGR